MIDPIDVLIAFIFMCVPPSFLFLAALMTS